MLPAADCCQRYCASLAGPWFLLVILCLVAGTPVSAAGASDPSAEETRLRRAAQLRGMALAEMEDANYGLAVEHLDSLAEILPDNVLPPVNLAVCYLRLNRPDEAMAAVRRAQELAPDNAQVLYTLARILEQEDPNRSEWAAIIEQFIATHPRDVRPHFLLAEQRAMAGDWEAASEAYQQAIRRDPENLVLLTDHLVAAAEARDPEQTLDALYAIEDRLNGFDGNLVEYSEQLAALADEGQTEALRPPALVLRNLLRPTELYQLGLVPLTGGQQAGGQMFPQLDFSPPLPKSIQGGQDIAIAWIDATAEVGLAGVAGEGRLLVASGESGDEMLLVSGSQIKRVSLNGGARIAQETVLDPKPAGLAIYRDIDQDHIPDLAFADTQDGVRLYLGREDGTFASGQELLSTPGPQPLQALAALDIDHDGDLDLFVARTGAPDLYLQNNGDGSWSERAQELGLGGVTDTYAAASADFDDDGDLDLVTAHGEVTLRLLINRRSGPLLDSSAAWGLDRLSGSYTDVAAADFDRDGLFDLLTWGSDGGMVLRNSADRFEVVPLPTEAAGPWRSASTGDFDNDGDQDVLVVATDPVRTFLLRNRRSEFVVEPAAVEAGDSLLQGDFDNDGDLDALVERQQATPLFWRNDGGNRNQWLRLQLRGRSTNNSKNNTEGLFTRIEVRIGDDFQALLGNGRTNHLGLGAAQQADVIRVEWTNGLAQSWLQVAANRTLVEEQVLKGSCPFLYTWNGEEFEFVTDLMWRSPLGMVLPSGGAAPHESASDFVLIPGDRLTPSGDDLWIQITEELWETVYVDRLELMAVDHPANTDLVVDEAFRPPPHPTEPPAYWLERHLLPIAARDHQGGDVLHLIQARDGRYVHSLPLSRYQGLTDGHHLELTFDGIPANERLLLVLWGWIFPTDSSINFALSQNSQLDSTPPSLQILQPDDTWTTLLPFIGFPNGKRKAVVVELTGRLPVGRATLRIPTNMQIYWDAAILAVGEPETENRWTRLDPAAADLHYRGFSHLYRETVTGPHLFDYREVEVGPRFRDMRGSFTRFGDVAELLAQPDDRYVVMNAGDEITVRFDARQLPPLRQGWRRDWILFTDGWVKDGDLHTAYSQTVEPLPYHGMSSYPDGPAHRYPDSEQHNKYLRDYQTREVDDTPFRVLLRKGDQPDS